MSCLQSHSKFWSARSQSTPSHRWFLSFSLTTHALTVAWESRPSKRSHIQMDTFIPSSMPLCEVLGHRWKWFPFDKVVCKTPGDFSDNLNAFLLLLSGSTFYQIEHGTVKNFQRELAWLRISHHLQPCSHSFNSYTQQMFLEHFIRHSYWNSRKYHVQIIILTIHHLWSPYKNKTSRYEKIMI